MGRVSSSKLRRSAKDQDCTAVFLGICNRDPKTVVLAHIRDDYKGMGNKASDISAAFMCFNCHDYFDRGHRVAPVMDQDEYWRYTIRAMQRTQAVWVDMGLMVVPQDIQKPKAIKPRKPKAQRAKIQSRGFGKFKSNTRDINDE